MTNADDFAYNARELAKARPHPEHPEHVQQLQVRGAEGASRWLNITQAQYFRVVEALTTEPGITYRVQAHDITELTWPMWDACGIECPAMIGADCPRKHDESCPGRSSRYDNAAAEVVHGWSLETGQSDECGGGETGGTWFGLFRTPDGERHDDNPMGAGVILTVTDRGFVSATRFDTASALDKDWATLVEETRECPYETDGCMSGELCAQCTDDDENEE